MSLVADDSDGSSDFNPEPEVDAENVHLNAGMDEGSDNDQDDDESARGGNIFDMEAIESDGSEAHDEEDDDQNSEGGEPRYFPQFARLPFELQMKIWEAFCPDLTANVRLFDLTGPNREFLRDRTFPVRAVMAVHQKSRQFALKSLPHSLSYTYKEEGLFIHFNRDKDIVIAPRPMDPQYEFSFINLPFLIPGLTDQIVNLAVPKPLPDHHMPRPGRSRVFPRLKNLFIMTAHVDYKNDMLRWCASDKARSYETTDIDCHEDGESLYQVRWVWPDLDRHRDYFAHDMFVMLHCVWRTEGLRGYAASGIVEDDAGWLQHRVAEQLDKLPVWPLIMFDDHSGITRLSRLTDPTYDEPWNAPSDADGSQAGEPDEYESSGIDDSDIEEPEDSDSEDDIQFLDDGDSVDEDGSHAGEPSFEGLSSPTSQNGGVMLGVTEQANFSSPEPESETADEATEPGVGGRALKRRRRVLESDDEQSEDEAPRKRLRHRRIDSDLDDSDGENGENENANEEESGTRIGERQRRIRERRRLAVGDDNEESEDSDEESDDSEPETPNPKPMSLAQKLQLHREQNPIVDDHDDEESDEMEDRAGGGLDYDNQMDFQDDEEGDDESGEGAENGYAVNFEGFEEDEEY